MISSCLIHSHTGKKSQPAASSPAKKGKAPTACSTGQVLRARGIQKFEIFFIPISKARAQEVVRLSVDAGSLSSRDDILPTKLLCSNQFRHSSPVLFLRKRILSFNLFCIRGIYAREEDSLDIFRFWFLFISVGGRKSKVSVVRTSLDSQLQSVSSFS